jgi:mannan endo-1,4-beta-mannosidase
MKSVTKITCLLILFLMLAVAGLPLKPARAAVGFHINGRNLLDANGNNFIIRGISHAHVWYPSNTASFADIKNVGKANTIRVVLGGGNRWGPNTASDVANVINLCKTNRLVCVLEDHDTTGFGEDGAATTLANAVNYWKSIQSVLTGQEAYVIINIGNEPYGNNNVANWVTDTKNAIIAMRAAGFQHTLMVDAPNWGQDHTFTMRDNAASIFASDTARNTIFSVHMYEVYTQAATIQSYINTFKTNNLPLVVGEFGSQHGGQTIDVNTILSYTQANGVGWMAWSWSGNGGSDAVLDMVTGFNASQPSAWGQRVMTGANGLSSTSVQASVYGNPVATFTPTRTPTRTATPTGPTPTPTRTPTRTVTPTPGGPTCSPVTASIAAPFVKDGAGTFCWQSSNLGSYVNSWNLATLTINGVTFTNIYVASGSYPAKNNGFYYVGYTGNFAWSHFEAK